LLAGLNPARCKRFYNDGVAAVVAPEFDQSATGTPIGEP
jgi:hypothetical protein